MAAGAGFDAGLGSCLGASLCCGVASVGRRVASSTGSLHRARFATGSPSSGWVMLLVKVENLGKGSTLAAVVSLRSDVSLL